MIWVDNTPEEFFFPGAGLIYITSLTMQPITLPTDGRESFSVFVNIDFFHSGYNFDTGQTIDVSGGARGTVSFFLTPSGFYENEGFVEAPEPGTLALVGTGLVSVVALARRRLRT